MRTSSIPGPQRTGEWQPALSGAERERALALAITLADGLRWADARDLDASLASGAGGLALMFATMAHTLGDSRYDEPAERYLSLAADRAVHDLSSGGVGLYAGLTGVAWVEAAITRLRGYPAIDNEELDELLAQLLARPRTGPWELTAGLVGIGLYALEHAETNPGLLRLAIDRLCEARSPRGGWVVDSEALFGSAGAGRPAFYLDLGMAHGLAGLVAFAALAARAGADGAGDLLSEATGALLAHRLPPGSDALFPALVDEQGPRTVPLRWCYGDLGVAAALSLAAPLLSHPLVPQAVSGVLDSVPLDPSMAGVDELGLCHGVAGVAHVLHRVAITTGSARAWEAASAWGRALIERVESGERAGGRGWLEGDAGLILALISLATDVAPCWDRALLLA